MTPSRLTANVLNFVPYSSYAIPVPQGFHQDGNNTYGYREVVDDYMDPETFWKDFESNKPTQNRRVAIDDAYRFGAYNTENRIRRLPGPLDAASAFIAMNADAYQRQTTQTFGVCPFNTIGDVSAILSRPVEVFSPTVIASTSMDEGCHGSVHSPAGPSTSVLGSRDEVTGSPPTMSQSQDSYEPAAEISGPSSSYRQEPESGKKRGKLTSRKDTKKSMRTRSSVSKQVVSASLGKSIRPSTSAKATPKARERTSDDATALIIEAASHANPSRASSRKPRRSYPCTQSGCTRVCSSSGDLRRHLQSSAHKEAVYYCNRCDKPPFQREDSRKRHCETCPAGKHAECQ